MARFAIACAALGAIALAPAAQAQNLQLGGAQGGVTFGANGPQGFLTNSGGQMTGIQIDSGPGFAPGSGQASQSIAAPGVVGRTSFHTGDGNQGMGGYHDARGAQNFQQNPLQGPGSNFGLTGTQTGLMAPYSVNSAAVPSGSFSYGFNTNAQPQAYGSIYGLTNGVNNLIDSLGNRYTGGFINSGRQQLAPVSTGSVDLNTVSP